MLNGNLKVNCVFFLVLLLKCALHPTLTIRPCVCSLIGKKVFNVPKESLDGVENVIAICDAGQLDNKVLFIVYSSGIITLDQSYILNPVLDLYILVN